ncbi:hypothetical protein C7Y66_00725 [Chroococcidiopsis sp. CCALA 051]|uniref:hypothetical protein n=1 Tax=Chroococcidiopsis sp. CCALA 051 TaxID=869949 RepID=UPI000D0CDA11|nr:hypothetical protein [Chroococcidiopsis sp. CCALA 051]PSM51046.1 hypothetical protein C7Y66_00725 [Chroococcidiopsis sp. CCALA 051]
MKVIWLHLIRLLQRQNFFSSSKTVLPEVAAAALVPLISSANFNSSLGFFLFLSSATLLRLVWNGAIFIHGLGHAIAIATLDRQPNALNIVNILEHKSIAVTLRSLLPFQPIFIPGCDRADLWVAAGDRTPWRIRIKALGGVCFNLLAVVILWQFSSASFGDIWTRGDRAIAFISTFFSQTFLGANLLIILSSRSDLAAFVTGVAEIFCCGNFGFLGQRNADDDPRQLLPERVVNVFHEMGRETEIRGEQAGGGLVVATNRDNQTVFVGKKVVNKKRDNLTKSLETAFAAERRRAALAGIKTLESTVMGVWHYRFGTSGPPAVLETHWHEWMSARQASVWQFLEGEWVHQHKNVNHRITHNGDFDAWTLFDRSIGNTELGWWLERVLHTANHARGDSPKIAGMMDLLVTQGMWDASVRLAYQLAIAPSIESAFGGQKPAVDAPNTAPSPQEIGNWAATFENIFVLYRKLLAAPDSPASSQYFCRLEHDILQATTNDSSMSQWSWQRRVTFVRTAIHAFFHNDLHLATKTFMSRAEGSFGLVTVSTLEEGRLVLSAQGQPMSVGFNWQDGYMVYASEPAAVDAVLLNLPESYRLDLDQKMGEIAMVTAKDIAIYSMSQKCEVASSDLKDRWISMADHPYLPHVKYPENDTVDPIAADCREIPPILAEIRLSWQNSASLDRQSADYLVQLFCEKAHKFEQKRQKMVRAGLTGHMQQLPSVDLLVTGVENSLWLGERFAQDLKIVFPWLNVRVISSNEVLQQLQHDFSSLQLGKDSIVLAITQSGQTFPTVQAIHTFDQLYRQNIIGELFILTGELSSFLGSRAIQPKHSNTVRHNIFVNGSGRRTSEPATIAVAAAQHTLTELLLYLAKQVKHHFPDSSPFGMTLTQESLAALEKMKDDFLDINVVQIMGTTPTGNTIETAIRRTLIAGGRTWALHILETPLAWGIHALYVAITVGWAIPFGHTIPLAKTILDLIVWAAHIPQDALFLGIVNPVVSLIDIAIYIFGSWLWTLGLRYFQGRQLLARIGKRTLVIGDVPWVSKLLKSYVSKLFSLSYGIASLEVHGANPEDDLLHDFGHRVVRGTLLFLGVPDGRRGQKQKHQENAAIMTGKQADGVRNIDVGPEVVVMGANPEIARKGFSSAIVLEGNDEYFYFRNAAFYFKEQNAEDQKELIEDLRESRFGAFERLLASYVFFWALAKKVASFPFLRYQHWKSQSRTKIMTTAAPVAGMSVETPKQLYQPDRDDKPEVVIRD